MEREEVAISTDARPVHLFNRGELEVRKALSVYVILCLVMVLFSSYPSITSADSQSKIQVDLNGKLIPFANAPIIKGSTVMIPFKELFKAMGIIVNYDAKTKTITGRQEEGEITFISLTIGRKKASVNETVYTLSEAPQSVNGVTYIPLRFVGEATGAKVTWNGKSRLVTIKERQDILLERLCKLGDSAGVSKVLAANPGMDLNRDFGVYLHNAILYGKNLSVVQSLVLAGADPNIRFEWGSNPLAMASNVSSEWVIWLLDNGADPALINEDGKNALEQVYLLNDDRRKSMDILADALGVEYSIVGGFAVIAIELPYSTELTQKQFKVTFESLSENELSYILKVRVENLSMEQNNGYFEVGLFADDSALALKGRTLLSGNSTFGKGNAVYEYAFGKPDKAPETIEIGVQDGSDGKVTFVAVKAQNLGQIGLTFQQLAGYLQEKYGKVLTDSGIAEFEISVYDWIYDEYRIEVAYDTRFFWNASIMTPAVQQQLREHMKRIATDTINRFPDRAFAGTYHHSWYKYPNIRVDLQTRDYMTWDTGGTGQEAGMPAAFRWTPSDDDELHLF